MRVVVETTRTGNAMGGEARDLDFNSDAHLPPKLLPSLRTPATAATLTTSSTTRRGRGRDLSMQEGVAYE